MKIGFLMTYDAEKKTFASSTHISIFANFVSLFLLCFSLFFIYTTGDLIVFSVCVVKNYFKFVIILSWLQTFVNKKKL